MRRTVPDGNLPQDRCLYGAKRPDGGGEGALIASGGGVQIPAVAKIKRAGAKPTLFVDQDKGAAMDFVESPGCACTDVLRSSAAGHYFLGFFFDFFAMVISPAVPIIGGSALLDKADELYVT
jgi:hypothetical protein